MAFRADQSDLAEEAGKKWTFFLVIQIVSLVCMVVVIIPALFVLMAIALFVGSIILMVSLMGFMKRCGERL
ncbi:hypothetical protein ACX93W_14535 [Paenibacillus sp. CAU 1782]